MEINKEFLGKLFEQAVENPRLRQSYDLRTSSDDNSQRILNALLPGTAVPIHRHPNSNENVQLLCGKLIEIIYDENGNEKERIHLDPTIGNYGGVIPPGAWHTVEVLEPSVIYEAKDGSGSVLGYVVETTSSQGYGGNITLYAGIAMDGTLNGISILEISETPGLGMRADQVLTPQFQNKKVSEFQYTKSGSTSDSEIDAISGATITTKALTNAVNGALKAAQELGVAG